MVNFREDWRGHLWQGRFASYPMDNAHLLLASRYIELNPVRAGLAKKPGDYQWSSAQAHLSGIDDLLVCVKPLLEKVDSWGKFLAGKISQEDEQLIQMHERTGKPLGNEPFVRRMEKLTGREFFPKKPGPKKKN